tara:strand:- start:14960 stop:15163 length:204 start_codon:yes stop_codon:yes gene_type:complete
LKLASELTIDASVLAAKSQCSQIVRAAAAGDRLNQNVNRRDEPRAVRHRVMRQSHLLTREGFAQSAI